jgi:hypothetical protein
MAPGPLNFRSAVEVGSVDLANLDQPGGGQQIATIVGQPP